MGAFDTITIPEKCPFCNSKNQFGFQTDDLGQLMRTFGINDKIKALNFVIKEGVLKDCKNSCKRCDKMVYCDFTIKDGKISNYKIKKREGKMKLFDGK